MFLLEEKTVLVELGECQPWVLGLYHWEGTTIMFALSLSLSLSLSFTHTHTHTLSLV
jgi:hypothetical protein